MDIVLIIIGSIVALLGLIGCIIPALPGPPLNYVALLLLHFTDRHSFSTKFLIWTLVLTVLVTVLDYLIPVVGTRRFGGTKYGIWGCVIGMLAGAIFFPPFGLILGGFFGAIAGEMIGGKEANLAFRAGVGSFMGFLAGTLAKLIVSGLLIYYFIEALL
ncbi:MAG TPA: DUF456 domain-containing protein [Cytophagales bacterium]|jgi:uncharacterized protein YqgC (DUF456 family)|nr:DUF456 domain-containing protein [Cytophagales bacterium]